METDAYGFLSLMSDALDAENKRLREALAKLDRAARTVMQHLPLEWHTDPKNFAVRDQLSAALEASVELELER